ncbi:MAG: hypothetical protein SOS98_03775 [Varibaculum sp.]|nr:hypothetical protein [Varibaculum sp.]
MPRVLLIVLAIALDIYAIADIARTPADEMPARIPKALAIVGVVLLSPIGAIAWIIVSRVMRAEDSGAAFRSGLWSADNPYPLFKGGKGGDPAAGHDVAPDDDPEFLFRLQAQLQREKKEREPNDSGTGSDTDTAPTSPDSPEITGSGIAPDGSPDPASPNSPDEKNGDSRDRGDRPPEQ